MRHRACVAAYLLLFFALLFGSVLAHPSTASFIGPGGGGSFFEPTVSPLDPDRVLVACDMTAGYVSQNGGESWHSFNLRGRILFFAFDPKNRNAFYAKSIGLWRSADAGVTWSLVYPDPNEVTGIEMRGDHAGQKLITRVPRQQILALAIDPANSQVLYGAFGDEQSASFVLSRDSGRRWETGPALPAGTHRLFVDPNPRVKHRNIYAIGKSSMAGLLNGKWIDIPLPEGVKEFSDASIGFSRRGFATLYLLADGRLFVSSDVGKNWRRAAFTGNGKVRTVAASPDHPNIAYASYRNLNETSASPQTYLGVARTEDSGTTWKLVRKEVGTERRVFGDDWIGEFFGSDYAAAPLGLAVAPHRPMTVYSTDQGRVLRSDDGGEHWKSIYSSRLRDGSFSGTGLEGTNAHGVHFDPFDSKRIFISYTDIGLFRSENGAAGWIPSNYGVPTGWLNTTYWMVFDPAVRGRAWAVMSRVHDLPRTKIFARRSLSSFDGGVVISDDGAKTWRKSNQGMEPTAATDIVLDLDSPPGNRTLYVAACGRGVYKSSNGGKSWELKNIGMIGNSPLVWRVVQDASKRLYAVVVRRSEEALPGSVGDGALYYSADSAEHWRRMALPPAVNAPNGLAVDPKNPDRLYLAAWGRYAAGGQQGGGIYLSADRGQTWIRVLGADQHIFDVTVDPTSPNIVYAVGFESSAWRSNDSGLNWRRIPGYNFKWGQKVIPDVHDPSKIYIATYGGGVWHGPAEGDVESAREILTPVVAY